jgi:hypothetical protein
VGRVLIFLGFYRADLSWHFLAFGIGFEATFWTGLRNMARFAPSLVFLGRVRRPYPSNSWPVSFW